MSSGVIVADDQPIFLAAVRSLIDSEPDLKVLVAANSGEAAIAAARRLHPRLFITDIAMPGIGGLEAVRQIATAQPLVKIMVFSTHHQRRHVLAAVEAGANGYLLKNAEKAEFLFAVHQLLDGHSYLSPSIAGHVVAAIKANGTSIRKRLNELTPREREVLCLIAEGGSTRDIATSLGVSSKTVATHREHLVKKLGIHSSARLARLAVREGLIVDE